MDNIASVWTIKQLKTMAQSRECEPHVTIPVAGRQHGDRSRCRLPDFRTGLQVGGQWAGPSRVRPLGQQDGSVVSSPSAAGSVRRRIVRAQRCLIKTMIRSTTALPAKSCPESD